MIFQPTKCRECPCYRAWHGVQGGTCRAIVPNRGLYEVDENVRPPIWCPAREGVTVLVSPTSPAKNQP